MLARLPWPWLRDPRSVALMALAAIWLRIALLYSPAGQRRGALPVSLEEPTRLIPLWVFGIGWVITAAIVAVIAARSLPAEKNRRRVQLFAVTVFMPLFWAVLYWIGWILADFRSPDWSTALLYWLIAVVQIAVLTMEPRAAR